jgi:hypothetical protein
MTVTVAGVVVGFTGGVVVVVLAGTGMVVGFTGRVVVVVLAGTEAVVQWVVTG